jgi:monoamine oxidase
MYDYIIIGGGISGLYCALNLHNCLLLESNDYLGGRILTNKKPHNEKCECKKYVNSGICLKCKRQYIQHMTC